MIKISDDIIGVGLCTKPIAKDRAVVPEVAGASLEMKIDISDKIVTQIQNEIERNR